MNWIPCSWIIPFICISGVSCKNGYIKTGNTVNTPPIIYLMGSKLVVLFQEEDLCVLHSSTYVCISIVAVKTVSELLTCGEKMFENMVCPHSKSCIPFFFWSHLLKGIGMEKIQEHTAKMSGALGSGKGKEILKVTRDGTRSAVIAIM